MIALMLATAMAVSPPVPTDEAGWVSVPSKACQAIERRYKRKAFWLGMGAFVAKGMANRQTAEVRTDSGEKATIAVNHRPTLEDVAWTDTYYQPARGRELEAAGCPLPAQ